MAIGMAMLMPVDEHSHWTAFLPGEIVAMIGTGIAVGIAVGIAALGAFFPHAAGLGADKAAFVDGLQEALLAGAIVAAAGALLAMVLIRPERRAARASGGQVVAEAAA